MPANAPDACPNCGGALVRDPDVLDTWFSSALWPFATLGWPEQTPELEAFYPTDVLSTARDIIFLWVARMVMMGVEFTGELPFTDVPIHSVIQAPDGRRMSKSLGTGIDPIHEIDELGADAVRFGLLAMSSSQDVRYSAEKVKQGRDLANKLWNASRLILLRVEDVPAEPRPETVEDRWIVSRLERATKDVEDALDGFHMSRAALDLYDFFWSEVCDWYLELVKPRLYDEDADRSALSATLLHVLERTRRAAPPDHAVRDRGGLGAHAGRARAARGVGVAVRPARADRPRGRGRASTASSRRSPRCAATATTSARPRARGSPRGSRPRATRRRPSTSRGSRAST